MAHCGQTKTPGEMARIATKRRGQIVGMHKPGNRYTKYVMKLDSIVLLLGSGLLG